MEKTVIEVNGIKLEVDLRYARKIEEYKVGDNVKLLKKSSYGESYESKVGVIIGFDAFQKLPTIVVAYLDDTYSQADIKFCYINANNKENEIAPMPEMEMAINKELVLKKLDRDIEAKQREMALLEEKKSYFLQNFGRYFEQGQHSQDTVVHLSC